ncbi:MAG: histidine phosphatase family protein [Candidatus Aureabacteria bacterium]|nr:histidine phosphatase family protein [Candidatus Auribacterota bacterium]
MTLIKKIALCRHFPIPTISSWKFLSTNKFNDWIEKNKSVLPEETDSFSPLKAWDKCLSSDLPRAKKTASVLASNTIIEHTDILREVPFIPFSFPFILPFGAWLLLSRLRWLLIKNNKLETKQASLKRASIAIDLVFSQKENNILVVSHGFFIHLLSKELKKRGFEGSHPTTPEYGVPYVFEKK